MMIRGDSMLVRLVLAFFLSASSLAHADNFSSGTEVAVKFGVHEVVLNVQADIATAFDTVVTVQFTPPSGVRNTKTVWAFYDGGSQWKARVYVSEIGTWSWSTRCESDSRLDSQSGAFTAEPSRLPGRLQNHPRNARQWATEDGRWFLNLSDTAYFLLCRQDGNGVAVSTEDALQYVEDDRARGITSLRCFLASHDQKFIESAAQWNAWYFEGENLDRLRLDNLQSADHRLRLLLNRYPEVAVQLIMFPLERYGSDGEFWAAMTAVQRERLLRNLLARFGAYPQIIWLIVNDAHYGAKFPRNNAMAREVGEYLLRNDAWQHPRSTGHARRLPFFFGDEPWATYIHIEHAHDLGALEYQKYEAFGKPVFLGEDRYEQDHGWKLDPLSMRYWQRRLFWAWLLSGGSANYGGRWWTVQPYSQTGIRSAVFHQRPATTFHTQLTGLDSARVIHDYFASRQIDLADFRPAPQLARSENQTLPEVRAIKLMRREWDEYLVYHPNAASDGQEAQPDIAAKARISLDLTKTTGKLDVEWLRAEDGLTQAGEQVDGGQIVELVSPWAGHDVVVWLKR